MFILDFNKQHLINLDQVISLDVNENKIEARVIKGDNIIGIPLITYNFNPDAPFTLSGLLCHIIEVISYNTINKNNIIDINTVFNEYISKISTPHKPSNLLYDRSIFSSKNLVVY